MRKKRIIPADYLSSFFIHLIYSTLGHYKQVIKTIFHNLPSYNLRTESFHQIDVLSDGNKIPMEKYS